LMYSLNPALTPAQVLSKLQVTSRPFPAGIACGAQDPNNSATWFSCACTTTTCGAGMLDAGRAVAVTAGAGTLTTLVAGPNPITVGSTVTFTAGIVGIVPTGTVTFSDNGATLAIVNVLNASDTGTASLTTSVLAIGGHPIVATYSGDSNNKPSMSPALTENVQSPNGKRKRDLNGDAKSDVLWQNNAGPLYEWLMNG